ncbi:hypothetical protein JCM10908_002495 [Rhodotorula pacifica]|uniref:uncharacterized protein n=1 Tax=Rhodotorula pacifica TaxID=1495444 RepID=UPI003178D889
MQDTQQYFQEQFTLPPELRTRPRLDQLDKPGVNHLRRPPPCTGSPVASDVPAYAAGSSKLRLYEQSIRTAQSCRETSRIDAARAAGAVAAGHSSPAQRSDRLNTASQHAFASLSTVRSAVGEHNHDDLDEGPSRIMAEIPRSIVISTDHQTQALLSAMDKTLRTVPRKTTQRHAYFHSGLVGEPCISVSEPTLSPCTSESDEQGSLPGDFDATEPTRNLAEGCTPHENQIGPLVLRGGGNPNDGYEEGDTPFATDAPAVEQDVEGLRRELDQVRLGSEALKAEIPGSRGTTSQLVDARTTHGVPAHEQGHTAAPPYLSDVDGVAAPQGRASPLVTQQHWVHPTRRKSPYENLHEHEQSPAQAEQIRLRQEVNERMRKCIAERKARMRQRQVPVLDLTGEDSSEEGGGMEIDA